MAKSVVTPERFAKGMTFDEYRQYVNGSDAYTLEAAARITGVPAESITKAAALIAKPNDDGTPRKTLFTMEKGAIWSINYETVGAIANLVVLTGGGAIAAHRNDSVDVLVVVLAGDLVLSIDDEDILLRVGAAVVVQRGALRGVTAGVGGVRYLTVHAPRTLSIDTTRHHAEKL